jgi:tetratricopeptide (TPR) repeat protein
VKYLSSKFLQAGLIVTTLFQGVAYSQSTEWKSMDFIGRPCTIQQGFGPYDYTNSQHVSAHLQIVEVWHFTPEVENLTRGKSGTVYGDLSYTIRAFPNHHRALYSLIQYQLQGSNEIDAAPECFLDRAINFAPGDARVYLLYGVYLHRLDRLDQALDKYEKAEELSPNNPEIQYDMALLYLETDDMDEAVKYAKKAYSLGYPLPGLRNRLMAQGYSLTD